VKGLWLRRQVPCCAGCTGTCRLVHVFVCMPHCDVLRACCGGLWTWFGCSITCTILDLRSLRQSCQFAYVCNAKSLPTHAPSSVTQETSSDFPAWTHVGCADRVIPSDIGAAAPGTLALLLRRSVAPSQWMTAFRAVHGQQGSAQSRWRCCLHGAPQVCSVSIPACAAPFNCQPHRIDEPSAVASPQSCRGLRAAALGAAPIVLDQLTHDTMRLSGRALAHGGFGSRARGMHSPLASLGSLPTASAFGDSLFKV